MFLHYRFVCVRVHPLHSPLYLIGVSYMGCLLRMPVPSYYTLYFRHILYVYSLVTFSPSFIRVCNVSLYISDVSHSSDSGIYSEMNKRETKEQSNNVIFTQDKNYASNQKLSTIHLSTSSTQTLARLTAHHKQ
jgi:hypothetical protein